MTDARKSVTPKPLLAPQLGYFRMLVVTYGTRTDVEKFDTIIIDANKIERELSEAKAHGQMDASALFVTKRDLATLTRQRDGLVKALEEIMRQTCDEGASNDDYVFDLAKAALAAAKETNDR